MYRCCLFLQFIFEYMLEKKNKNKKVLKKIKHKYKNKRKYSEYKDDNTSIDYEKDRPPHW